MKRHCEPGSWLLSHQGVLFIIILCGDLGPMHMLLKHFLKQVQENQGPKQGPNQGPHRLQDHRIINRSGMTPLLIFGINSYVLSMQ